MIKLDVTGKLDRIVQHTDLPARCFIDKNITVEVFNNYKWETTAIIFTRYLNDDKDYFYYYLRVFRHKNLLLNTTHQSIKYEVRNYFDKCLEELFNDNQLILEIKNKFLEINDPKNRKPKEKFIRNNLNIKENKNETYKITN